MKFENLLLIINYILSFTGVILYFILKNAYCLLLISVCLGIITFLKYEKIKKSDDMNYQNLRSVFLFFIGALFALFVFVVLCTRK